MKNDEDKEHIINPTMNTIFIFDLQMNNKCNNVGLGMQRSKDDMSSISTESTGIFVRSSGVFTQSLELWAQSTKKLVQSPNVFSQPTKGV
jgi:hypothetical protein